MKTSCPSCNAVFAVDDKRVPNGGLTIKCPKCKAPFTAHLPKPGEESKTVKGIPVVVVRASNGGTLVDLRSPGAEQTMLDPGAGGTDMGMKPISLKDGETA
jgi:predicted Zn finger-like uncharacterized protein